MPMTTSAAWGRPAQQDGFTLTWMAVPLPVLAQVADLDQLARVVRAGRLADADEVGQFADGARITTCPETARLPREISRQIVDRDFVI